MGEAAITARPVPLEAAAVSTVYSESFIEKLFKVARALESAEIPYAMGGAVSYIFYAEPRTTIDIDVNIFVTEADTERVVECLAQVGVVAGDRQRDELRRTGQARLLLDGTFVDLFFPVHDFHSSCARRARRVQLDGGTIMVLSAEDLVVFKTLFNRPRDWIDIEQVLLTQASQFDVAYTLHWIDAMVGPDDSTRIKLAAYIDQARATLGDAY